MWLVTHNLAAPLHLMHLYVNHRGTCKYKNKSLIFLIISSFILRFQQGECHSLLAMLFSNSKIEILDPARCAKINEKVKKLQFIQNILLTWIFFKIFCYWEKVIYRDFVNKNSNSFSQWHKNLITNPFVVYMTFADLLRTTHCVLCAKINISFE